MNTICNYDRDSFVVSDYGVRIIERDRGISKLYSYFITTYQDRQNDLNLNDTAKKELLLQKYGQSFSEPDHVGVFQPFRREQDVIKGDMDQLAVYNENEDPDNTINPRFEVQNGNWFRMDLLRDVGKQFYLEYRLIDETLLIPAKIMNTFSAYIAAGLYYPLDETTAIKLFDCATDLYLCVGDAFGWEENNKDLDEICEAVLSFRLKSHEDYEITDGRIFLTPETHDRIHNDFETLIQRIGGQTFLSTMMRYLEDPKNLFYSCDLDRYRIHRNKSTSGKGAPLPYGYLFQIALKHLGDAPKPLNTNLHMKIINRSAMYLDLLQVYNSNPYADVMLGHEAIPEYVKDNIDFETLCIPQQYRPDFIELVIKHLYIPKAKDERVGPGFYLSKHLPVLVKETLSFPPCSIITVADLHNKTNIKRQIINEFLAHFSQGYQHVNSEFTSSLAPTTTGECPLIDLGDGRYYLLSSHFSGYGFCEKMYSVLKVELVNKGILLDRVLGRDIELLVRKMLDTHSVEYKHGKYTVGNTVEESDLVIETNDKILFIELKKRPLPDEFEQGKDVYVYGALGAGMLDAQVQAFKHRKNLEQQGKLTLTDNESSYEVTWDGRTINAISMCLPEYSFFTIKTLAQRLTESLLFASYEAFDPNESKKLNKLNRVASQFRTLVEEYADGRSLDVRQLLFHVSFKSLQQLWVALKLSSTKEELVDLLLSDHHMALASYDFYETMKNHLWLKGIKNKDDAVRPY